MTKANRATPWRDVVRLREELKTGELSLAQFAADLHEVAQGAGTRPVYEDPAKFFALTFPTHALRELVRDVAHRLHGQSDKAVRQLELTYGGGKTHTLIALHHLFCDPASLPDLPAVREFREAVGGDLPRAFVASLCFDKIDVERGIENVRGPGDERRTLRHPWSVLAFQLAGDDGLAALHGEGKAEERETPPAEPLLAKLIALPQRNGIATLILVDEVLMYARQKAGMSATWRSRIQDFFQYLVQAVSRVDRAAVVASLLATDPTKSDAEGKLLTADLSNVFRRQKEEGVQPVAKEDVAEVLRRRFFVPEDLANPDGYRHHVIAAVRDLGRLDERMKKNAKAEEERFHASYPFHPDLTEVFYSRWVHLDGFQRTRGILRTLAIGLREVTEWDPCPVVGPAALLAAPGAESASAALSELAGVATGEQVEGKRTEWKQLLERELLIARQAQDELPALAPKREVEQAVVAVFLNSQPLGHKAYTPELVRLVGTGAPDGIELDKGLQRWRDLSWFLDDEDGGGTRPDGSREPPKSWRLGNRPNLRQMHDEAVRQRVSAEVVEERLVAAVRKTRSLTEGASAAGAQVHLLPQQPSDLPDDARFRFTVLGPEAASESGKPSRAARRFLDETTGADRPRVHRNTVVLAVPSRDGLDAARTAARNLLGWEEVQSQLNEGGHAVDLTQQQRLKARLRDTGVRLPEAVRQAYGIVVTTDTANRAQAFRLSAAGGPLFAQIKLDARSRIQETAVEPAALLPGGPYELWKEDEPSRRVAELADSFARYARLPKLLKPEVVRDTVLRGVEEGLFVARVARPDGTARTFWRGPVDPEAARDPGLEAILPENAELASLSPEMLDPRKSRLPELWSGEALSFPDLLGYFDGSRTVVVGDSGLDQVIVPRCNPDAVREAAAGAVRDGIVWLVNGPTSLWKEPPPAAAVDVNAVLRPPPESVPTSGLLPESLPGAWTDGATNGVRLNQALSQARGETLPWGLVRESIRAAVNTRWLTLVGGAVDCEFDQAGQLVLERPAEAPEQPSPPTATAGAVLEVGELQDLAELAPDLASLTAGYGLRYRVRPELDGDADAGVRDQVNERLAEVSADLKVE